MLSQSRIPKQEVLHLYNYVQYIKSIYPQLHIESYTPNDIGQNNDVFILNDKLVFRFPKYKKGIDQLRRETRILKYIRNFISTQIPNPIYSSLEKLEIGKVFTGYELIKGVHLWNEDITEFQNKESLPKWSVNI